MKEIVQHARIDGGTREERNGIIRRLILDGITTGLMEDEKSGGRREDDDDDDDDDG